MPGALLKAVSANTPLLFEKSTENGFLRVYQTDSFGKLLTLGDIVRVAESDHFVWAEMMAHPVLFTSHKPQKVLVLGHALGLVAEIIKHTCVQEVVCVHPYTELDEVAGKFLPALVSHASHITYKSCAPAAWLKETQAQSFDVIIVTEEMHFAEHAYLPFLSSNGMLAVIDTYPMFDALSLQKKLAALKAQGFPALQVLQFMQPSYAAANRLILASKASALRRLREKDIYYRGFDTHYYNYDIHKAALVLPASVSAQVHELLS